MVPWSNTGRMTAGGKGLEYACYGPAPTEDAPVIVMLHEGLGSAMLWRDVPANIADATGLGVIVYSRAGYGFSAPADLPRPLDYMTREAVEVLPDVLDQIGARRVILLGHSDGATIAAEYAGRVQDHRVRGLILIAPHFFTETMGLAEIAAAKVAFETSDLSTRMSKHHADAEATFRGWNDAWLAPGFVDWHVGEVIDYWRIPCLAIQGAQDQYGTLAQLQEIENRAYVPVEICVIEGARHAPHLETPEQTLTAISEFCARLVRLEAEKVQPA